MATIPPAERWLPVIDYEGMYEVSDLGRVRSIPRIDTYGRRRSGIVLKPGKQRKGHLFVTLSWGSIERPFRVHLLVMTAFVGPRPTGLETRHLNGDPTDNRLVNLCYGTSAENHLDMVRHGTHNNASKTHCKYGHEYTHENTLRPSRGGRRCRECHNAETRERQRRKRAERKAAKLKRPPAPLLARGAG